MSKEGKFHKLVEDLDREEKNRVWAAIKEQEELRQPKSETVFVKKSQAGSFWRKAVALTVSSIIVLGGSVFVAIKFLPIVSSQVESTGDIQSGDSDNSSTENENRYCDSDSYDAIPTEMTLKEFVDSEQKTFLYLDWYEITDYCLNRIYRLNESEEIIGYREEIMDINTGSLVQIHILLKGYQLEALDVFQNTNSVAYISGVQVEWKSIGDISYAKFEYGEYDYYIALEYPMETDSILDVVQELLN